MFNGLYNADGEQAIAMSAVEQLEMSGVGMEQAQGAGAGPLGSRALLDSNKAPSAAVAGQNVNLASYAQYLQQLQQQYMMGYFIPLNSNQAIPITVLANNNRLMGRKSVDTNQNAIGSEQKSPVDRERERTASSLLAAKPSENKQKREIKHVDNEPPKYGIRNARNCQICFCRYNPGHSVASEELLIHEETECKVGEFIISTFFFK
ncbi:hypothetical protein WR25_20553 isoform B [Diploscapter pachys]|uniref:Uncharacterized protein n=1 Tax=Diploscapter pachys TaxID=2018661 RepID=A0A2A2JT25_9BILA|nr:hypothetical protein WR25_20553 isoform B [Diploscapter pachys]